MIVWVRDFRASTRYDLPARDIRCAMAFGLILVFFAYGVVYLASYFGMISSHTELMSFVTMNVVAKLGMLVLFVGIRSSQFFDLLVDLLVNKSMPFTRQHWQCLGGHGLHKVHTSAGGWVSMGGTGPGRNWKRRHFGGGGDYRCGRHCIFAPRDADSIFGRTK